jgi:ADP-heptose:LPS heptosyltransferase
MAPLSSKRLKKYHPQEDQFPKNIIILRALMLGDLLCTVPAFRALRKAFPLSKITLVGLPWAKVFVERFRQYLDDFIEFPGYPGLPERKPEIEQIPDFIKNIQAQKFDLALQMHGSGPFVNSLVTMWGAQLSAGFYEKGDFCPDPQWFTTFPLDEHEITIYLRLMGFLGIPLQGVHLEFPLTAQDENDFFRIPQASQIMHSDYVCVHPGARLLTRRWHPERFAEVADQLSALGLKVVLTGDASEAELVGSVSRLMKNPHINLAGQTSLGSLGVLIKGSKLLVSNDTGVAHVASALEVPSVIVVTGSDPRRWGSLNTDIHKTVSYDVPCRPCNYERCPLGLMCGRGVEVDHVVDQATALLKNNSNANRLFPILN